MDQILTYLPESIDPAQLALAAAGFMAAALLGQNSALTNAASSAIGILFIYVATVAVMTIGGELEQFRSYLSPLPFIRIEGEVLYLFSLTAAEYHAVCYEILSMVILAFLVNLLDTWIPRGEHIITWFLFRCATVILAILAHWGVTECFTSMIPDVIAQNAAVILLGLLAVMLAVGCLKFVVGIALATVNPIIAALYTFFFANVVGRQLSKAVLTTALLTALVWVLGAIGMAVIPIDIAALTGYLPFLGLLAVLWYLINKIL